MYIVDNYSTDGSWEYLALEALGNSRIRTLHRKKCSRGEGKQIAMEAALQEARPNDIMFFVDFDEVYGKTFIDYLKYAQKKYKKNDICIHKGISRAELNKKLFWRNLNYAEDVERVARARAIGANIIIPINPMDYSNIGHHEANKNTIEKKEYSSTMLGHKYRTFRARIDYIRGTAFNLGELEERNKTKSRLNSIGIALLYIFAKINKIYPAKKGISNWEYSHFEKINNKA